MLAVFDLGGLVLRIVRVVYLVIQKLWIKKKKNEIFLLVRSG